MLDARFYFGLPAQAAVNSDNWALRFARDLCTQILFSGPFISIIAFLHCLFALISSLASLGRLRLLLGLTVPFAAFVQEAPISTMLEHKGWFRRSHRKTAKPAGTEDEVAQDVVMHNFDILALPEDVLTGIFTYMLTLPDVPRLCRVSSQFNSIANSNTLWKLRWFYNWNLNVLSSNIPTSGTTHHHS